MGSRHTYLLKFETVARGGDLLNFSIEFLVYSISILSDPRFVFIVFISKEKEWSVCMMWEKSTGIPFV